MRPLRIAALVVAIAAAGVTLWGWLGLPGIRFGDDPVFTDPYYQQATARAVIRLTGAALVFSLFVSVLAWLRFAQGRVASIGLWMILVSAVLALALGFETLWHASTMLVTPRRISDFRDAEVARLHVLQVVFYAAWASLLAGAATSISAVWFDKRRTV